MDWFFLALLSAFSLATADALCKRQLSSYGGWQLLVVRFVIPGILLTPFLFLYPLPANLPKEFWLWMIILIPLEIVAMLLYMKAINEAPLYQTLPYLSFTPVFTIVGAWLVLGEQVSLTGGTGIILVVVATYYLNIEHLQSSGGKKWIEPFRAITKQRASIIMLAAAFIYSITAVGSKAAMQFIGPVAFGALYFVAIGFVTLFIVIICRPRDLKILSKNISGNLFIGLLMAIMVMSHFLAIADVEAAYMIAVKRLSLLFGIIYGAWLFHEKGLFKNITAALLMMLGVIMILFA